MSTMGLDFLQCTMSPAKTTPPFSWTMKVCGAQMAMPSPMLFSNAPTTCDWSMFLMTTSLSLRPRTWSHVLRA